MCFARAKMACITNMHIRVICQTFRSGLIISMYFYGKRNNPNPYSRQIVCDIFFLKKTSLII
jgi:hypothetical protein